MWYESEDGTSLAPTLPWLVEVAGFMISARVKGFPITVVNPADPSHPGQVHKLDKVHDGIAWHVLISKYIPPSHLHWGSKLISQSLRFP